MSAPMPIDTPRPAPDLSALRISREPEKPKRPLLLLLLGTVLALAIGLGSFVFLSSSLRSLPVEKTTAALITEGQAMTILSASGYVEAETKADISPKITSRITELRVTEGTRVKQGEIIARLDHQDLDAQLAEAQANWAQADADLARQSSLFKQGLAPKSTLDAAVASEASTRARVDYIKALVDYTVLRAPFDGVVVAKRAHVGEAVSPFGSPGQGSSSGSGGAIVTLVDFATLYVGADVNESNLARLGPKQPAEIVLEAYPEKAYRGTLNQVIPSADRQKGTVKVKVGFLDPDEHILPDLSARVNFTSEATQGQSARTRIEVPKSALAVRDGTTGVFLIEKDRAVFRPVKVGRQTQATAEIESGLSGGETLVANASIEKLENGVKVTASK
ncbi:MAG TPA: efflux RND transporter periplasmic adaptor subunit [Candidatus Polarisedimenticolia bacterium]|nr:efflux RND transporter periplasmic adaptor subunit [Candidatus Polarisedimenticolia bacterium]